MREARAAVGTIGEEELNRSRASCAGIWEEFCKTVCGVHAPEQTAVMAVFLPRVARLERRRSTNALRLVLYPLRALCTKKAGSRESKQRCVLFVVMGIQFSFGFF